MKKFKVTVTRTVEYEVEVDETKWSAKEQEDWERVFWDLPIYSDPDGNPDVEAAAGFACGLAEQTARLGKGIFIEGFGKCADSKEIADYWNRQEHHKDDLCTEGLYIQETDDDIESEIEDITDEG